MATASTPTSRIRSATCLIATSRLPTSTRRMRRRPSSSAVAAPMPAPAPVMIATLPASDVSTPRPPAPARSCDDHRIVRPGRAIRFRVLRSLLVLGLLDRLDVGRDGDLAGERLLQLPIPDERRRVGHDRIEDSHPGVLVFLGHVLHERVLDIRSGVLVGGRQSDELNPLVFLLRDRV